MEPIIQQIAQNLAKKITKRALGGELKDIDALASAALSDCKSAAKEIIETIAAELNQQIRADKATRQKEGFVLKEKDRARRLLTELGEVNLPRDYYYDKETGRYVFLMDQALGLRKYARVGDCLSARLVTLATDVSYAKSAAIASEGQLSRQTVKNHILQLSGLETLPQTEEKKTRKELHVYADEDHVHMQKPKKQRGKWNKILPLVTVTEGTIKEEARRNKTVKPMHFVDEKLQTANLWKSVEGYIGSVYDVSELEAIYLHGDGGKWIQNGLENFKQTIHVMDGYHLGKRLKGISRTFPKQNVRSRLNAAIGANDRKKADTILQSLFEIAETEEQRKYVTDFGTYLMGHWASIVNRITLNIPGSCTEAQISHVLSERFSRDPLGWSEEGLGALSKLRVYVKNGGEITASDFKKTQDHQSDYSDYADRIVQEGMSGAIDWSVFDGESPIFDGASGTQILMERYGSTHNHLTQ